MGLYGLCRVDSGQQVVRQYHKHRVGSMQRALQSVQSGWCATRCGTLESLVSVYLVASGGRYSQ